jgi:hypothetical protein
MLLIVADCFNLSSQRVTPAEKLSAAKTWSRVLFGVIPEHRLQETFDATFAAHNSPFPISAYDLKTKWQEIEAEEEAERQRIIEEEKAVNRVHFCPNRKHHVNEHGDTLVCNPFNFNEEIELPCMYCRPQAFADARLRFIQKHGEPKPMEILANISNG